MVDGSTQSLQDKKDGLLMSGIKRWGFDRDFMNGFVLSRYASKSTQMGLFHANYTLNPASGMPATIINDQSDE